MRHAHAHLGHLFRYLPGRPGYNRRLRAAAGLITTLIRLLAVDTSPWTDDVWVVDSTPVECGRSRDTARRSDLAGWAEYGYCASHSRYFWGLSLHLVATLGGTDSQGVRAVQQGPGQLRPGGEHHLLRDPAQLAVLLIRGAPFGQVQGPADQNVATGGGEG